MASEKYIENRDPDIFGEMMRRQASMEQQLDDLKRELRNQNAAPPLSRIDPTTYPDPYEGQRAIDVADEQHTWYSDGQWRKAAAGGIALYEIKVVEDINVVTTGDGKFWWPIPDDLDAAQIIYVDAGVSVESSSGPVEIQIAHQVGGTGALTDICSTKPSIAVGDKNATPGVVSGGAWDVSNGDWLRIDVDASGVGAKGLAVMVGLTPSPLGSLAITGATGPPGGITTWTGVWNSSTTYTVGQAVSHNGTSYVAITGSTNVEPGVTSGWQTYWMVLAGGQQISSINFVINGGGFTLLPGTVGYIPVYFSCTIVEATILADIAGSAIVDIWKDTYGNYPPTSADSITGSSPPTLSGAQKNTDTSLVGWTTTITAGDVLAFNVNSASTIRRLTISLKVLRS